MHRSYNCLMDIKPSVHWTNLAYLYQILDPLWVLLQISSEVMSVQL